MQITDRAGIPANATAVVLNVTATNTTGPGFVTAYPAGQTLPLASNLNPERAGQNIPNLVTVPIGAGGQIAVYTLTQADIIVDAFGYYTPATTAKAGRYVPAGPVRAYDSRRSRGPLGAGETVNVPLESFIDKDATAVVLNVTADRRHRRRLLHGVRRRRRPGRPRRTSTSSRAARCRTR